MRPANAYGQGLGFRRLQSVTTRDVLVGTGEALHAVQVTQSADEGAVVLLRDVVDALEVGRVLPLGRSLLHIEPDAIGFLQLDAPDLEFDVQLARVALMLQGTGIAADREALQQVERGFVVLSRELETKADERMAQKAAGYHVIEENSASDDQRIDFH
jgi:hypothetical protein